VRPRGLCAEYEDGEHRESPPTAFVIVRQPGAVTRLQPVPSGIREPPPFQGPRDRETKGAGLQNGLLCALAVPFLIVLAVATCPQRS
jgi:hypothetical protein